MNGGATPQRDAPALSVVVPSRERPLRVRWLLNELEDQTLAPEHFEVLVAHPPGDPAENVVAAHPLGRAGRARSVRVPTGTGRGGARNAGWRAARASLVAFTHDDCRPPARWLEDLLSLAEEAPGAPVRGGVDPDPEQGAFLFARFKRVRRSEPTDRFAPACNVAFPRAALDRLGGFEEAADTEWLDGAELAATAHRAGLEVQPAPGLRVFHAIRPVAPVEWLRDATAVAHLPEAVRRTPALRDGLVLGVALRGTHLLALGALVGVAAARRRPAAAALALPWLGQLAREQRARGSGWGRVAARLPVRAARDMAEVGVLAAASARARTPCL